MKQPCTPRSAQSFLSSLVIPNKFTSLTALFDIISLIPSKCLETNYFRTNLVYTIIIIIK